MPKDLGMSMTRHNRLRAAVSAAVVASSTILDYYGPRITPVAWHNSIRTGQMLVNKLLEGHPERIRRVLGTHKHVFQQLVHELYHYTGLDNTRGVSLEESVAITLHFLVTNNSVAQESEMFQRSPDTISQ
jgi:hypothetical protein